MILSFISININININRLSIKVIFLIWSQIKSQTIKLHVYIKYETYIADEFDPVPFSFYLTFANPRGRGCFHGRGFLPAFPIPRINEWLHREKRSGPEELFFALWPFRVPEQHRRHDASSNWKRGPEMRRNEGESANARRMPRSLLKGRGSPNKKGVSFSETAYRANWVRRYSFSLFPLVSPLPLVWYLINYENWTYTLCRTFSTIRGELAFVSLTK